MLSKEPCVISPCICAIGILNCTQLAAQGRSSQNYHLIILINLVYVFENF